MEIVSEDGAKIAVKNGEKAVFGRGLGFDGDDRTVSHRHVELEVEAAEAGPLSQTEPRPRVSFVVVGKNPIWVWSRNTNGEVKGFRRSEKGELVAGDRFCVSGKRPIWFSLTKVEAEEEGEKRAVKEVEDFDVSGIDPVKEFGFILMGHEFDIYPKHKHKICDVKSWDWFLEETRKDSDSDDDGLTKKARTSRKRKRRKSEGEINDDDDDEWTSESDNDKELVANMNEVNRPKYSTRSKDVNKPLKCTKSSKNSSRRKAYVADEDEDDETLGGFIVVDDDVNQEEIDDDNGDEEEEEEFVEDEDDELDD